MNRGGIIVRVSQVTIYGIAVAAIVLIVKYLGLLTPAELAWYDFMVKTRQNSHWDEQPVVIVGLLDSDANIDRPVNDRTLARVLAKLCQAEPRAIGIDLLRDKPVGEGGEDLAAVIAQCPTIVGVSLFGRSRQTYVPAPAALRATGRYGFSDVIVDPDNMVRRGLLALDRGRDSGPGQAEFSLSLRVARLYLARENIRVTSGPEIGIQVGPTPVPRLRAHDGGYVRATDGGYQILLDYLEPLKSLEPIPIGTVLSDNFNTGIVQGRIVLIGNMTAEAKDHFATPIGVGRTEQDRTPGVALHAYIATQLIRYGRQESRPMRFAPEWAEALALLPFGVAGALAGWRAKRRRYLTVICTLAVPATLVVVYAVFAAGWWVPATAPALVFIPSATIAHYRGQIRARVFLSYAREDEKRVRKVQERLVRSGFDAWMDRMSIEPGERWQGAIREALRDADCFVLCVSAKSVNKEGVLQQELQEALDVWRHSLDGDYRIVPARLDDVQLPKELDGFQWVDVWSEKDWSRFKKALSRRGSHARH